MVLLLQVHLAEGGGVDGVVPDEPDRQAALLDEPDLHVESVTRDRGADLAETGENLVSALGGSSPMSVGQARRAGLRVEA